MDKGEKGRNKQKVEIEVKWCRNERRRWIKSGETCPSPRP